MKFTYEVFFTILSASWVAASVSGISYQDPINQRYLKPSGDANSCNPLYWYPRTLPGYCYKKNEVKSSPPKPLPPPALAPPAPPFPPIPMPIPMPYPVPSVPPYPPLLYSAVPQYALPPPLMLPLTAQMPFGMPSPSFRLPPAGPYYPPTLPQQRQAGMVPGVPGIVSPDGGINILPFSDAYSDMLEKHKQKLIRIRLEKVLNEYDDYPYKKYRKYKFGKRRY